MISIKSTHLSPIGKLTAPFRWTSEWHKQIAKTVLLTAYPGTEVFAWAMAVWLDEQELICQEQLGLGKDTCDQIIPLAVVYGLQDGTDIMSSQCSTQS